MYKYDLHMHSCEGSMCSNTPIVDMVRYMHGKGFSGAVITNHFINGYTRLYNPLTWDEYCEQYMKGYYNGLKVAAELDFDLIFGLEECYCSGHEFLCYGLNPDFICSHPELWHASIKQWREITKPLGAVIVYAHPFRGCNDIPDVSLVDGIELYNAGNNKKENDRAMEIFGNTDLIFTAGGDKHNPPFDYSYGVVFDRKIRNSAELASALKEKKHGFYLGE